MALESGRGAPWLEVVHALRARKGIDRDGRLLLEGLRLTAAAHRAGVRVERAIVADEFVADARATRALIDALVAEGVPCHALDGRTFSRISYKADGVVAIVRHAPPTLERVVARAGIVVALDALSDPGNVGAVIRSANAWGAAGVVAIEGHDKLFHPKSLRASMGAIFDTPTCAASRDRIARAARPIVVLSPDGDRGELAIPQDAIVVLGNEKRGVHPDLARRADLRVAIPTVGIVDSLNVSHAAAILLWEAFRRRRA